MVNSGKRVTGNRGEASGGSCPGAAKGSASLSRPWRSLKDTYLYLHMSFLELSYFSSQTFLSRAPRRLSHLPIGQKETQGHQLWSTQAGRLAQGLGLPDVCPLLFAVWKPRTPVVL